MYVQIPWLALYGLAGFTATGLGIHQAIATDRAVLFVYIAAGGGIEKKKSVRLQRVLPNCRQFLSYFNSSSSHLRLAGGTFALPEVWRSV